MNIDALREISESLNIKDVASFLGLNVNRAGYILCPIHNERTPSCKLYESTFHCFGCGGHGDSIDLVVAVRGCKKAQAAVELNERFGLGVNLSGKTKKLIRRQKKPENLSEKLREKQDAVFELYRELVHAFGRTDALDDNLGDFCQRLLDDDDLRITDPLGFWERYKNEFRKYANTERRYREQRRVIERSRRNGQPYPWDEIWAKVLEEA